MSDVRPVRVLEGLRVIEFTGIGPVPHAALQLALMGATVTRIDRLDPPHRSPGTVRGREVVTCDLKAPEGRRRAWQLIEGADVLIEGFRPGVMERLGFGPAEVTDRAPGVVYTRLTGWGQEGPLADRAGHDINFLALSGMLHAIGRPGERPVPPVNLVGDFGGGSMPAVVGILGALLHRARTGEGCVIDAAITDGVPMLANMVWSLLAEGRWVDAPGSNLYDGGAPFYDTYECADGRFVAVGAVEPQFYRELIKGLGLHDNYLPDQSDRGRWPELRRRLAEVFRSRTCEEWVQAFDGVDACVTPVLSLAEAPLHPHNVQRNVFEIVDGVATPRLAPIFVPTTASRSR